MRISDWSSDVCSSDLIMPWHGSITLGKTVGEAAALHATLELVARLDVELMNSGADPMPDEGVARMQVLLGKANYLDHTWELMKRRAKRAGLPLAVEQASRTEEHTSELPAIKRISYA